MRSLLPEADATYCASQEGRGLSVRSWKENAGLRPQSQGGLAAAQQEN